MIGQGDRDRKGFDRAIALRSPHLSSKAVKAVARFQKGPSRLVTPSAARSGAVLPLRLFQPGGVPLKPRIPLQQVSSRLATPAVAQSGGAPTLMGLSRSSVAPKAERPLDAPRQHRCPIRNMNMSANASASIFLAREARALLQRLARIRPFSLEIPSVLAAAVTPAAQTAIEVHMMRGRGRLRTMVMDYLRWLRGSQAQAAAPAEVQSRFTFLRLRFHAMLSQFDIFAEALVQRTEHDNGVRLSGLDVVAADALRLPGGYFEPPPVICYLVRGHGAAIRRARTRLPGGGENPVAIVRVPRERMVGSGIASSLVHEVGHQAAALLDLVNSLRPLLRALEDQGGDEQMAWKIYERTISEVIADFWAVARVGVAAMTGLMGVVSLPRAFVFRINMDDPHPFPWIRVRLSAAMGRALYPHPQWARLEQMWDSFYPLAGLDESRLRIIEVLLKTVPSFVALLANHRPRALRGRTLIEVLDTEQRQPSRLANLFQIWGGRPSRCVRPRRRWSLPSSAKQTPTGGLAPEEESRLLTNMLTYWALRDTLDTSAYCSQTLSAHCPRAIHHSPTMQPTNNQRNNDRHESRHSTPAPPHTSIFKGPAGESDSATSSRSTKGAKITDLDYYA